MTPAPLPLTIAAAGERLRSGSVTVSGLVQSSIDRADALDARLGVYVTRFDDTARAEAQRLDAALAGGDDLGPLHGIPIGVKDIIAASEGPTTGQSVTMDPAWGDGRDSVIVRRLKRAGAIVVGKTTTMEYAIGFPDPAKPFPLPRNPWDLARWPGGSSSGSGAGVAAGFFLGAIGTDTGGSIRYPAAFCGITGYKQSFGRVPKGGVIPLGFTLDHAGPMTRSAYDAALMLDVIAGYHPSDAYSADVPYTATAPVLAAQGADLAGLTIGAIQDDELWAGVAADILEVYLASLQRLRDLGATVVDFQIPMMREARAAGAVTVSSETMAMHRNGLRDRWDDFHSHAHELMMAGLYYSGADYVQGQKVRRAFQKEVTRTFSRFDALVAPTAAREAPFYAAVDEGGVFAAYSKVYGGPFNLLGNPALATPIGFSANGMPLSAQFVAPVYDDLTPLRIAHAYQQVTDFHLAVPPLVASVPV